MAMEKRKLNLLTGLSAALLIAVGPSIASWLSGPSVGSVMAASLPSISGVVKDDAGKPLRGVTVTATSGSGFRNVTGLTDRAGRYKITDLKPDTYEVSATAWGFEKKQNNKGQLTRDAE